MEFCFTRSLATSIYKDDVWEILCQSNHEFIPPLSFRESTTQMQLNELKEEVLPSKYFQEMLNQLFVIAVEENKAVGFLTYRYGAEGFGEDCVYVSTIIVKKNCRNKQVAENLYRFLFDLEYRRRVVTRTWSLNAAHIHLLEKLDFVLIKRIKNNRGQGIDTVYFQRIPQYSNW